MNLDKTAIMHFRHNFFWGNQIIQKVEKYKYLGIWLDSSLSFSDNIYALAISGGRALGKLIGKFKSHSDVGYKSFTKVYESFVDPVLSYAAGVWGYKAAPNIDRVQNGAARYFLGVGSLTPIHAIEGDMGWFPTRYKRYVEIIRVWNRFVVMDDTRLTNKIFLMTYEISSDSTNWCSEFKIVCERLNIVDKFENLEKIDVGNLRPNANFN